MNALFARPAMLFLALAVLPALVVFAARFAKLSRTLLPLVSRMDDFSVRPLSFVLRFRSAFFALAWLLLVCAAAEPRWGSELVTTRQEGSAVMFVIDVSRSMTVSDVSPTRLAFASSYASMLMTKIDQARCGVVLVKGDAVLAIPLTADHRSVNDLLDSLSPSMLSAPGTDLAAGINAALAAFPPSSTDSRAIVLLTDGDATAGSLDAAARSVRAAGAKLVIVGVGTREGRGINAKPSSAEGETVVTVLRDEILRKAARSAGRGGLYVTGVDSGSAQAVLESIVPRSAQEEKLVYSPKPVYRYTLFLGAALFFFCAGCLTGGIAWRKK